MAKKVKSTSAESEYNEDAFRKELEDYKEWLLFVGRFGRKEVIFGSRLKRN
jgi:hypothetical protein